MQKQVNQQFETSKKLQLSVNDALSSFKIKDHRHLHHIGKELDKVNEQNGRLPIGIKTINKNRQPIV